MTSFISNTTLLGWFSAVLFALGSAIMARQWVTIVPLPLPRGGRRGKLRREALESPLFATIDPLLRRSGAALRESFRYLERSAALRSRLSRLELKVKEQLVWAGEPGGLDRFEIMALSFFLALTGATIGARSSAAWIVPGALIGLALPYVRLQSLGTARFAEVGRELPAAVDLIALAMNAGTDFPGAIRRVIEGQSGVVADELSEVLRSLDLGITRRGALLALKERVPVREVKDLVRAVLLAEQKGASITEALAQQAQASRQRRSVRAEEAAARAGVLLIMPIMLLMGCILIMLVGPLMTAGVSL